MRAVTAVALGLSAVLALLSGDRLGPALLAQLMPQTGSSQFPVGRAPQEPAQQHQPQSSELAGRDHIECAENNERRAHELPAAGRGGLRAKPVTGAPPQIPFHLPPHPLTHRSCANSSKPLSSRQRWSGYIHQLTRCMLCVSTRHLAMIKILLVLPHR